LLNVELIAYTPDPEKIVTAAAKLCYSASDIKTLLDNLTIDKIEKFVKMLESFGHESPFEHVSFSFGIEGVSRSLTHQLVRHRIASYSQQSQRYVRLGSIEYIVPPTIEAIPKAKELFIKAMENDQEVYDQLTEILIAYHLENGMDLKDAEKKAIEDARYVLSNACETKIVVTMNARSLFNFFNHRCCNRAQWEIRELAYQMLMLVRPVAPNIFRHAGPSCLTEPCPEGAMTCGKIVEIRKQYLTN
jgi:thymidylate synthase (FAD)